MYNLYKICNTDKSKCNLYARHWSTGTTFLYIMVHGVWKD